MIYLTFACNLVLTAGILAANAVYAKNHRRQRIAIRIAKKRKTNNCDQNR